MIWSSTSASPISSAPSKNSVIEQVLPVGGQLDDAHRPCRRQSGVAEQAHRVVLVLDQLAHRLERPFVLEVAVEDRPAQLVPAVGADMVHRVELPEQVRVGIAGDPQPQRGRPAGTGEPDGLAVDDREPELVLHGLADGFPAATRDVEMGGLAAPVGDGEELVRREEAERQQWDGDADRHPGEDVEGMVDAEVEAGERNKDDDGAADELGDGPRPAGHHDGIDHADGREADDGNRRRGQRVALPAPDLGDVVGPGSRVHPDQQDADDLEDEGAGQVREQVAPAAERHHRSE